MISNILEKGTPCQVLYPIELNTPAGIYHGLKLPCVGIDSDDLLMVPLPPMGDRPGYLGRFRPEYTIRLDEGGDYADW
jgi:hypothetical protein